MINFYRILISVSLILWLIILIIMLLKISIYNWALWIVPLFFLLLTIFLVKFLLKKQNDKFMTFAITQASLIKLVLSLAFLLFLKLFLTKSQWINFTIFTAINYLIYTIIEVKYLLNRLK